MEKLRISWYQLRQLVYVLGIPPTVGTNDVALFLADRGVEIGGLAPSRLRVSDRHRVARLILDHYGVEHTQPGGLKR